MSQHHTPPSTNSKRSLGKFAVAFIQRQLRSVLIPMVTFSLVLPSLPVALADEPAKKKEGESSVGTGPWITQARFVSDDQIVAAESQGLLLRPGKVLRTTTADLTKFEPLGEQETSIWTAVPIGDGKVAASNYKGEVFIHGSGEPQKIELTARWIRALEKAPGDKELLAGTEDGKLVVLSVGEKKESKRIEAHAAAIFDIAINSSGDRIATVAGDGTVKVWTWPGLEPVASGSRSKDAVWSVVFTNDGKQIVTGGADRRLRLWDAATGKFLVNLTGTSDWVTSIVTIPHTSLVAAGCLNGQVVIADYVAMLPVSRVPGPGSGIWSLALSPNGKQLAVSTRKHGIALIATNTWDAAAKEVAARAANEKPPAPQPKK